MAHRCSSFWGKPAKDLTRLLDGTTRAERTDWNAKARHLLDRPFEGWVHRASAKSDYDEILGLFHDLLLALKQPADAPNQWGRSKYPGPLSPIKSATLGKLAGAVREGLRRDGEDLDPNGVPCHSKPDATDPQKPPVDRYGTPNWLEQPNALPTLADLDVARGLLVALRRALGT